MDQKQVVFLGLTDVGKNREENQDRYVAMALSSSQVLVAAIDGVGGYVGGEIAAQIAQDTLQEVFQKGNGEPLQLLKEAVVLANNRIVEKSQSELQLARMSCVLTCAMVDINLNQVAYVHVGDSRMYRLRGQHLHKITKDHSMVGEREDLGELTEEVAMKHPRRSQIRRWLGSTLHRIDDDDFLDFGLESFLPGDNLLLCSDGLTDMITRQEITDLLTTAQPLHKKGQALVAAANKAGGHDNITVVLVLYPALAPTEPPLVQEVPPISTFEALPEPEIRSGEATTDVVESQKLVKVATWWKYLVGAVVGILISVAGSLWFFNPGLLTSPAPNTPTDSTTEQIKQLKIQLDSLGAGDTLRLGVFDTLSLVETIRLPDSVWVAGGGVVIRPATDSSLVAFSVPIGGWVHFDSVRVSGFEVGVQAYGERVEMVNCQFPDTKYPVVIYHERPFNASWNIISKIVLSTGPTL